MCSPSNDFLCKKFVLIALLLLNIAFTAWAQDASGKKTNDAMGQMLALSGPGRDHRYLEQLAGNWSFQDARLKFVKGTLVRKPIYEGRFYMVEITGGKLQLPIADGKMKEGNYHGMQIEGFDNAKGKFVTASINNHIGSDIQQQTGIYTEEKKEFSYEWDSELIKGQSQKNRRVLKITDKDHYVEEYFELKNGSYTKVRQLNYTRVGL
jgi:hypothetical protein